MDKFLKYAFSMSLMALALFGFFIAIAVATFVENDFGTPVAQKWVYKSDWFAAILFYLSLSLIYNIYRYKLIAFKKIGTLTFHLALLVILIGAYTTRKIGFEGVMTIREGQASNFIISSDAFVQIKAHDLNQQYSYDLPIILDTNVYSQKEDGSNDYSHNYFEHEFDFPGQSDPIRIEFADFLPHIKDTILATDNGKPFLELVTVGDAGRNYQYLESGKILNDGGTKIAFNNATDPSAIQIFTTDSGLFATTPIELTYFQMMDQTNGIVKKDSMQRFFPGRLYDVNGFTFVFNKYHASAALQYVGDRGGKGGMDGMLVNVSQGQLVQQVMLVGGKGYFPVKQEFQLGQMHYELAFGSKITELPFSIFLRDFEMERYPGTNNPSSFASEVTVIDHLTGESFDHRIFMNNVLDYQGYRFFQSSYDEDERGTILSVNYDVPGSLITYIGYFLLGLGFLINLFSKESRFRHLIRKSQELNTKASLTLLFLLTLGLAAGARAQHHVQKIVDYEHAEKFGHLVIQDLEGRFKPVHTMATELLRKVHRSDEYEGLSAMQVFLGIHTNNLEWNLEPLIAIPNSEVGKKLNLPEGTKYACIQDFLRPDMTYILSEEVRAAQMKRPAVQTKFDKDVLKVDERFNILLGVYSGFYFKVFPLAGDSLNSWFSPFDPTVAPAVEEAEIISLIMRGYFQGVDEGYETGDWSTADLALKAIGEYQRRLSPQDILPSATKIEWEVRYNKMNLFKRLYYFYLAIGLVLLVMNFFSLFFGVKWLKWPIRIAVAFYGIAFIMHGFGLGLRWYLSGHAPWSNGYEAVVFIAFIVVLAGILFHRMHQAILGAAGILAWLMLFVAHMNSLDPEITNLVPVLKSYWLMIHVAIITGSYAFLGLACILALFNMAMFSAITGPTKSLTLKNAKQLTYVIEMLIIIGLFMLTIGTFLGGVWANESWGRYWGWDAKETWALASVVVYAIILHFRFIPGLKGMFAMNIAALWGYSAIIMTFFGVNFYLSGLHSYAQGDPIPIPTWVPITVLLLMGISIFAYIRYRIYTKTE